MTNDALPSPDQALATDQAAVDWPASVSAFVAAAITEHRRDHGFSKLLADLEAAADPPEAHRTWARDTLGVS